MNQTHYVINYKNIDSDMLHFLTSEKADTMCLLIYCVKFRYFFRLNSGLIRHTMLSLLRILIQLCFNILQVKNQTLCVS